MTAGKPNGFQEALENRFTVTAEIPPPRGADPRKNLEIARAVAGKVDGVNVTDNQRGIVRMSAQTFAHLLTDVGCEPILQICCRDRNRLALQSDLLGASALGISTICIMTGDHPRLGDNPGAKAVYDIDAIQLMKLASDFSRGINIHGKPLKKHPSFLMGGVINPFYEPLELELLKVRKKIIAGARFFQTQPFFDMETVDAFLEAVKPLDTKILVGVTPLKSAQMIDFLNENVLTKPIPESVKNRMVSAADPAEEGFRIAAEFIDGIRKKADGVHIMPIGQISKLPVLLEMIEG